MKITTKDKKGEAPSSEPGGTKPQSETPASKGADTATSKPTAKKKQKKGFSKGKSGNPKGRPKGSKNRSTLMAQALISGQAVKIVERLLELAVEGHPTALKLAVERIIPRTMSRHITFDLPPTDTSADLAIAYDAVLHALADGELALDEVKDISELLVLKQRLLTEDIGERLTSLEDQFADFDGRRE